MTWHRREAPRSTGHDTTSLLAKPGLSALLALMLVCCSTEQIENSEVSDHQQLARQLNDYAAHNEPGVQYVVVDQGTTLFNHSVGLSDVRQDAGLSSSHTMAAFSMTKTLTAIAVLQLVQEQKIQLHDKASDYVTHPYDSDITIQHLLNHTSGIPNPIPLKWVHLAQDHQAFDESSERNAILDKHSKLDFRPGEKYQYSNIGYWLLGGVIERVSGLPYTDYVTQAIFQPLNLKPGDIGFQISDETAHAKGYLKAWSFMGLFGRFLVDSSVLGENEKGWLHINNVYLNGPAFGGAIGTSNAFSSILQDLLSDQSVLLNEDTKPYLYQRQRLNSGAEIEMTLGWHIGELNGETYYYKEGGGAGFHSEMRIYPTTGIASVIMANRTSFNSRKILSEQDSHFVRP